MFLFGCVSIVFGAFAGAGGIVPSASVVPPPMRVVLLWVFVACVTVGLFALAIHSFLVSPEVSSRSKHSVMQPAMQHVPVMSLVLLLIVVVAIALGLVAAKTL